MIEVYNSNINDIEEIFNIEFVFESMYTYNNYIYIRYISDICFIDMSIESSYITNCYFFIHRNTYGKDLVQYEKLFDKITLIIY